MNRCVSFLDQCVGDNAVVTVCNIFFGAEQTAWLIHSLESVEQQGAGGLDERPIALFLIFKATERIPEFEKL